MKLSGGSVHLRNDKNADVKNELLLGSQGRNLKRMDEVAPTIASQATHPVWCTCHPTLAHHQARGEALYHMTLLPWTQLTEPGVHQSDPIETNRILCAGIRTNSRLRLFRQH